MRAVCVYFLLLVCAGFTARAQDGDAIVQKLAERIDNYSRLSPTATLFVHFDKTVYTPSENSWFTGYLLAQKDSLAEDRSMAIVVVRNADRTVLASARFVMQNGISFGNLFLPDSLPGGNYTFIAYTNVMVNGSPAHVFMQPITIKAADTKLVTSMHLLDSSRIMVDSLRILLNARTTDITLIAGARIKYWLGDGIHHSFSGEMVTDRKGEAIMSVPVNKVGEQNFLFSAQIQYKKETKTLRLRLPLLQNKPTLKLYPEGGHLVDKLNNVVGCEIRNAAGEPVETDAVLYENGEPVRQLYTNAFGFGRLVFTPHAENRYSIQLVSGKDSGIQFPLPAIEPQGMMINITRALSTDTIDATVTGSYTGRFAVVLHNYQKVFVGTEIDLVATARRRLRFALDEVPRGLCEITISDSNGRPMASRIFFAHYDKKNNLSVVTDSSQYSKRGKVEATLHLTAYDNKPASGLVSIACVQDNRLDVHKMTDIESYVYLNNALDDLPFKNKPLSPDNDNQGYLEDVMLIKGWRKYSWRTIDTLRKKLSETSLSFTGEILPRPKKPKTPFQLLMLRDSSVNTLVSDSLGRFRISEEEEITNGKRTTLFLAGNAKNTNSLVINDPYNPVDTTLALQSEFPEIVLRSPEQNSQLLALKSDEFTHLLPTVTVVSSSNDNSITGAPYNGDCTDYVCMFRILNCPNHPFSTEKPVKGNTYFLYSGRKMITYMTDCTGRPDSGGQPFKGIEISKEFYVSDYAKFNPPDPELVSTVYWKHLLPIENGLAKFSFYTGDIPGKFRIVVQGITIDEQPVYADRIITIATK